MTSRRRSFPLGLLSLLAAACLLAGCRNLKNEQVLFYPSAGYYDEKLDLWAIPVQGWVYEPKRYNFLRKIGFSLLTKGMSEEEMRDAGLIYEGRANSFIVDGTPGIIVKVNLAGRTYTLPPSDPAGRFERTFYLERDEAERLAYDGVLQYEAVLPWERKDQEPVIGIARLIPPEGVSVISDIDDTIKVSNVTDKMEMVRTMFIREYRAVEGMAAAYRKWSDEGAMFHYVSASPQQLYTALMDFTKQAGFPDAVFSLKRIGWFDAYMSNLWVSSSIFKPPLLKEIVQRYPHRKFILVGDSTEHDPEVYGDLARAHPEQIIRIYIRHVGDKPFDDDRYAKVFRDLPRTQWRVFRDASELSPIAPPAPTQTVEAAPVETGVER